MRSKTIVKAISILSLVVCSACSSPSASAKNDTVGITVTDKVLRPELPPTLFGFNMRWTKLQQDLWDHKNQALFPDVQNHLAAFPNTYYRYPGGLVANYFDWERSVKPRNKRTSTVMSKHDPIPYFGVGEYLQTLDALNARMLYTLNLTGATSKKMFKERSASVVAQSNGQLAAYLKKHMPADSSRLYQLGNELDRSHYEWSHEKYIERSRSSIEAILKQDSSAEFIAFLREFNWRYRDGRRKSHWQDFTREVLTELPQVNNFSIHLYYDDYIRKGGKYFHIPDAIARIERVLKVATETRPNDNIGVWITEHSRRAIVDRRNEQREKFRTTNLSAAVSTGDFLIAMAQLPAVRGTSLQALNGVARQIFDARIKHRDRRPRPVFYALRVLRIGAQGKVLETLSSDNNHSSYLGGYDIRATALRQNDSSYTLWVANRANKQLPAAITFKALAGKNIRYKHHYLAGKTGLPADRESDDFSVFLDAPAQTTRVGKNGLLQLPLPPSSVSSIQIEVIP